MSEESNMLSCILLYARFWHKVLYDCGYVQYLGALSNFAQSRDYCRPFLSKAVKAPMLSLRMCRKKMGNISISATGEELVSQIEKMSKSKLNGVTPDEIIEEFGADSLRLYEMFMGPLEKEKIWNTDAVSGCRRFLNRFYDMAFSDKVTDEDI